MILWILLLAMAVSWAAREWEHYQYRKLSSRFQDELLDALEWTLQRYAKEYCRNLGIENKVYKAIPDTPEFHGVRYRLALHMGESEEDFIDSHAVGY